MTNELENKINKMVERINLEISSAHSYFEKNHENNWEIIRSYRGMIEMLEILTDEECAFDLYGFINGLSCDGVFTPINVK